MEGTQEPGLRQGRPLSLPLWTDLQVGPRGRKQVNAQQGGSTLRRWIHGGHLVQGFRKPVGSTKMSKYAGPTLISGTTSRCPRQQVKCYPPTPNDVPISAPAMSLLSAPLPPHLLFFLSAPLFHFRTWRSTGGKEGHRGEPPKPSCCLRHHLQLPHGRANRTLRHIETVTAIRYGIVFEPLGENK